MTPRYIRAGDVNTAARRNGRRGQAAAVAVLAATAMLGVGAARAAALQGGQKANLPYATIDHPQFIPAAQAGFLHDNDLMIGVSAGKIAKSYPAAILAQHGVVQDRMPDGPIAVTW